MPSRGGIPITLFSALFGLFSGTSTFMKNILDENCGLTAIQGPLSH